MSFVVFGQAAFLTLLLALLAKMNYGVGEGKPLSIDLHDELK